MAKSTSIADLQPQPRSGQRESKPRKPAPGSFPQRAKVVAAELSSLPMKPLLIGAGIGAVLLGSAWAASAKRHSPGAPFNFGQQTLARTALVALARVISGQTMRNAAASALMDMADVVKSEGRS